MRRFILMTLFAQFLFDAHAQQRTDFDIQPTDTLKIQLVGTETDKIIIGGKSKQAGDYFIANQKINWTSDKQYIKVRNKSNKNILLEICQKGFKDFKEDNVYTWYFKKNHLSGKGTSDAGGYMFENLTSMQEVDGQKDCFCPHYMIEDTVRIRSWEPLDDQHGFFATTLPEGIKFRVPYIKATNELIITSQYLKNNGVDTEKPIKLYLEYYHKKDLKATIENIVIQCIPKMK